MNKLIIFFVSTFFLLPKLPLVSSSGLLIGEIILIIIGLCLVTTNNLRFYFNSYSLTFLSFLFTLLILSNIPAIILHSIVPAKSVVFFLRALLYALIPCMLLSSTLKHSSEEIFKIFFKYSIVGFLIYLLYFIGTFILIKPSLGDVLGTISPGTRFIMSYGLTITPEFPVFLKAVAGGSGNLLASHCLLLAISLSLFKTKPYNELIFLSFFIILLLLAQSRGGAFTILLWMSWRTLFLFKDLLFTMRGAFVLISLSMVLVLLLTFLNDQIGIFERYINIFQNFSLDRSSSARVLNYIDTYSIWSSSIYYMIFGIGIEEAIVYRLTGWTIVESFYLSLIFSGGFISVTLFLLFFVYVYLNRNNSIWIKILFLFLLFNTPINWAITGSDIFGPVCLFMIFFLVGLHFKDLNNQLPHEH